MIGGAGKKPFAQFYADPRSAKYEQFVADQARSQVLAAEVVGDGNRDFTLPLSECRVLMTVRFNLVKPVSYSKRVRHHTKKPDVDNYAKAVLDGLVKGKILADDGLVTDLTACKRYVEAGHPEGVEVDLTAIPTDV